MILHLQEETDRQLDIAQRKKIHHDTEKVQDSTIESAWRSLESIPPWPVSRFLMQMSRYEEYDLLELWDVCKFL